MPRKIDGTIKEMMEAEMDEHLGYAKSEHFDSDDYRNAYKTKHANSNYDSTIMYATQDRKSTYEPKMIKKRQKTFLILTRKSISIYAKGMTSRQIAENIEDI